MKYISKDAVIAEIERLRKRAKELYGYSQFDTAYENVLKTIDTLETKEVDLDKEARHYLCPSDIEKIEDYLNSRLYDWVSITNPDQRSCANVIPREDFIEDFKNYMKEE